MDQILTVEDLVRYLKVPKTTIYQMARRGDLPASKVGKHWRFRKSSIDKWLSDNDRSRQAASLEAATR